MYDLSPAPDHMKPLSAEISNIIHESSQKILDISTICTRMDLAQKQGERHLGYTKQDYEDATNPDYLISERRLQGIMGHYRIKEEDTQAKINSDEHTRRPTGVSTWSRDLAHRRVQTEEQEVRSRKRNRSRSSSHSISRSRAYPGTSYSLPLETTILGPTTTKLSTEGSVQIEQQRLKQLQM